jgi:hypothetical protein
MGQVARERSLQETEDNCYRGAVVRHPTLSLRVPLVTGSRILNGDLKACSASRAIPCQRRQFGVSQSSLNLDLRLDTVTCSLGLGGSSGVAFTLDIIKEIFDEDGVRGIKVAVISGDVEGKLLLGHLDELKPLGKMPQLSEFEVSKSVLVSQMGIATYVTALEEGAQIILAGRSCDVAIFAADAVRRGFEVGLASTVS